MSSSTITIRPANENDIELIEQAFQEFLGRVGNPAYIRDAVKDYPSALLFHNDDLIGFSYCGFMAPDVLEIANISLHPNWRGQGLGSRLLVFLENEVANKYDAVLLTNSDLYKDKRNATNFYLANGYTLAAGTSQTNLFWKSLKRSEDSAD